MLKCVSALSKKTNAGAAASVDLRPYYSFTFATKLTTNDANEISSGELSLVGKAELMAEAQAFPIDPASQRDATEPLHKRRPTRREDVLDAYRVPEPTPTVLDYAPDGYEDDMVVVCPGFVFADNAAGPGTVKTVPAGDAPVRSNDASAIMAYWNVEQFFDRMRAYGIDPKIISGSPRFHSRFTIAPESVQVREKMARPSTHRVRVKGFPDNFEGPIPPGDEPTIEMHLALADLSTRARKPWDGANRSPAEPLGIAADARWIWHEIGHVLLTTSVGELQFRFAHSPGDALAAIVSDRNRSLRRTRIGGARLSPGCSCRADTIDASCMAGAGAGAYTTPYHRWKMLLGPVAKRTGANRSFPRLCSVSTGPSVVTR